MFEFIGNQQQQRLYRIRAYIRGLIAGQRMLKAYGYQEPIERGKVRIRMALEIYRLMQGGIL